MILLDAVCILLSSFFALATRFEFIIYQIPPEHLEALWKYEPWFVLTTLIIFALFKIYSSLWEYAGPQEIFSIIWACIISGILEIGIVLLSGGFLPRSYYLLRTMYLIAFVVGTRFSYRMIRLKKQNRHLPWRQQRRVMIVGAGEAGRSVIGEIQNSKYLNQKICCIIDDDPGKVGKYIRGIKIAGDRHSIKKCVRKYNIQQIIITIPSASAVQLRPILDICKETDCELKIMPGVYQLVNGEVSVSKLRPVSIEDLLGREEIRVDLDEIMGYVSQKVIMVTGGGGSIGSELCRQIAAHNPKQLIIFDIYENNAYSIQQELKKNYPELNLVVLIGSIRDEKRLNAVIGTYRPQIIYHAAAHKHVPLMEYNPHEAVKNNIFGTKNVAEAAKEAGVDKFVMVSTDKAVNPPNVMGATKRVAEMIVTGLNGDSKTQFVAVRFGNVLGSRGSVVPLFKEQIKKGGPVTVTDYRMTRYFMTIPEASRLVIQASYMANGGEVFVLDMGEPVHILDLARKVIKLSGHTEEEIQIVESGIRPGEKLYEELLSTEERISEQVHEKIFVGRVTNQDKERVQDFIDRLLSLDKVELKNVLIDFARQD